MTNVENRKVLEQYLYEENERWAASTLNAQLDPVLALARRLGNRPWRDATRDDIIATIVEHRFHKGAHNAKRPPRGPGRALAASTKYQWSIGLRVFYKWLLDLDKDETPPQFKRLPFRKIDQMAERMLELALAPHEVRKLIRGARTRRDKCLVVVAVEARLRAGELAALRLDRMERRKHGWWLTLPPDEPGLKTGPRDHPVPVIAGARFIDEWLEEHPRAHDERAPLFVTQSKRSYGNRMTAKTIGEAIVRCAKRAGLRHVHAHMLRHTGTTLAVARGMNPESIRIIGGWSKNSTMMGYYTHASPLFRDMVLQDYGLEPEEPEILDILGAIACPLCGEKVEVGARACQFCGVPGSEAIAESEANRRRDQAVEFVALDLAAAMGWTREDGDDALDAAIQFLHRACDDNAKASQGGEAFVRWCLREWATRCNT